MNIRYWGMSILLVLLVSGCSTLPPIKDEEVAGHIVSIGRDGELEEIQPGKKILLDPGEKKSLKNQNSFNFIINGIRNFPKNEDGEIDVLIYVHGGLNTKKNALDRVQEKYRLIKYAKKEKRYPIFINWRSGPITTYSSHLLRIRQGEVSRTAKLTSPIYLLTDIGNSLVNAPKSWVVSGEHLLQSAISRDDSYLDNYKDANSGVYFTGNKNEYARLGRSLWWFLTSPSKLATTPFTYTMAKPAWDIMLRRTNTPFYTPSDLENEGHDIEFGSKLGTGALSRFLLELESVIKRENIPVKITIVGHSMGAIVVNKIVNIGFDLPYENIIHMASADSIKNLFEQVIPYVSAHDVKFYSLSLHPENEDREVSAWGLTPSGSLLVWIDNMFTTPETVMNKRSGRWENMERAIPLIPNSAKKKMYFKVFGLNDSGSVRQRDGLISEPQKHGEFGDLPFWSKSAWWK